MDVSSIIKDINENSTIVAIISGVITGSIVGIIGYCGVKKSTEATLKIASENIEFQKKTLEQNDQDRKVSEYKNMLSSIYRGILKIERNYNMTALYMESYKTNKENYEKYLFICQELDNVRLSCDLYLPDLSENIQAINSSINKYWGYLDWAIEHKEAGNSKQMSDNQTKAYSETKKIQNEIDEIKRKIKFMIKNPQLAR